MKFEDILKQFDFLFDDENDVRKDLTSVENNINILKERQEYAETCLQYLEANIGSMAPITLLTNLGLLSLGESLDLITNERHIDQYEIDFMMALVLKYGTVKSSYSKDCGLNNINKLLKAIVIYIICTEHKLHENNINAFVLNTRYRTNRIVGFDNEKLDTINEFCNKYDKTTDKGKIKLSKTMRFILAINKLIAKRLEIISGQAIYLEQRYKFFVFTPEDIKKICDENQLNYIKVIEVMQYFCCRIGELKNTEMDEIYLDNPIFKRFIIFIEPGLFFIPNLNIVFENLFDIFKEIVKIDGQSLENYSDVRAKYLEEKTSNMIHSKFKNDGKIYLNSQWDRVRHGENDCTLVYENYAIVFEDKSGSVNRNTYKGILRYAYKDNKKLVEESSEQAIFFSELLKENFGTVLELKVKGGLLNKIDLRKVNSVITIGVVFDETPLQNMTLGKNKHCPIVSIFQLGKIFTCLEKSEIIDYFIKRSFIESNILYHADEYDFLYTYLANGLNTSNKIYEKAGVDERILIPYKEGKITRGDLIRDKEYQKIIDAVVEEAGEYWLEKVISLLEVPPIVQKQIMRDIGKGGRLELVDNIEARKKVVIVHQLEYFDADTNIEVENDIQNYCFFSNVLYMAFTKKLEHVVVKVIKAGEFLY